MKPKEERFCPISLGDWMEVVREEGVPHVRAMEVWTFERDDLLKFDQAGPHQDRLQNGFETVDSVRARFDRQTARSGPGRDRPMMFRWDCCASGDLKFAMSEGTRDVDAETRLSLSIDDPRVFDILLEFPKVTVPVWQRPWIADRMVWHDGWPVEYRAFVEDGKLIGISSYYPQRPLRRRDAELAAVRKHVGRLLEVIKGPLVWPQHIESKHLHEGMAAILGGEKNERWTDGVHFTADFVATLDGMLFLEGGPPYTPTWGGHPCCFEGREIEGVALSLDEQEES